MHNLSTAFVLGFHGCDSAVGEAILAGEPLKPSRNEYDWLGWGTYFWEANPARAFEFAGELRTRREASGNPFDPMVIGAIIDLGFCLDMMSTAGLKSVAVFYDSLKAVSETAGAPMPKNRGGADLLRRDLDCAVINHLHKVREETKLRPIDTVRGVFLEGKRIYPDAGFFEKTHIQICVCNPDCIKGVFRVSDRFLR